ncbi:MBL fold metallo-hydrolase [Pyrodictium occultum]|nr:MBL fold metallo-hydrolase [Pyrodictium occultum]
MAVNTVVVPGALAVDPSLPLEPVRAVLLTHGHADHFRYAGALRERGARVYAPRHCLPLVENPSINYMATMGWAAGFEENYITPYFVGRGVRVDEPVEPGRAVSGEALVDALHAPGHTPGHLVYIIEAGGVRLLAAGDTVYGGEYLKGNPVLYHTDTLSWMRTLGMLERLDFDILVPGHGAPVERREARRLIDLNRGKIEEMLRLAESALDDEPAAGDEVIERLFEATGLARSRRAYSVYMPSVRALLNALTALGRARRVVENGVPKWLRR